MIGIYFACDDFNPISKKQIAIVIYEVKQGTKMKFKNLIASSLLILSSFFTSFSQATVIDFEDLAGSGLFNSLPTNYKDIAWSPNFWAYDLPQVPYIPKSGIVRIASNGSNTGDSLFTFLKGPVTFNGAWFSGNFIGVKFELFLNNVKVHTSTELLLNNMPTFLDAGYNGKINSVRILANTGQYTFDDLTFIDADMPEPVPAPATLLIVACGLFGMITRRWLKKS